MKLTMHFVDASSILTALEPYACFLTTSACQLQDSGAWTVHGQARSILDRLAVLLEELGTPQRTRKGDAYGAYA